MGAKKKYPIELTEKRTETIALGWMHLCSVCGVEFHSKREDAMYCGQRCRSRAHRERGAQADTEVLAG